MRPYATFLLSTVAGLCAMGAAQAAPAQSPLPAAQSYADLLAPVQNADAVLLADDMAQAQQKPLLQLAQYHHHHHHHHHHHGGFTFGFGIAPPVYYGRDCYIRREVHYNRYGERVVRRVRVCD
ncbi:MAG TPA: hypothetical protein VN655_17805 [Pseudolabrys sp.]|jgi:hypothetical protein|nr:hypothetical protein [Pseudolabrys sp.]